MPPASTAWMQAAWWVAKGIQKTGRQHERREETWRAAVVQAVFQHCTQNLFSDIAPAEAHSHHAVI